LGGQIQKELEIDSKFSNLKIGLNWPVEEIQGCEDLPKVK
jgi:hypothetical protein